VAPRILLAVDFLNLAFRAYYAPGYAGLTSPDGRPSGAVFGLVAMTQSLIGVSGATHVAFAFESLEQTHRDALDEGYKAGRPAQPADFHDQVTRANKAVGAMGWARYRASRYEADDTLATLARRALAAGFEHVYIATSDKDLFGAVSERTSMLWTAAGMGKIAENTYTPAKVKERYGVLPEDFADWKALAGDPSDRIKGCPGIGAVNASALLAQFGTLEAMYARLDEITSASVRRKLEAGREEVTHSLAMIALNHDATLTPEFDPDAGELGADDRAKTLAFLESWGMKTVIGRLPPIKTDF
jgi:DNA polymerase-1